MRASSMVLRSWVVACVAAMAPAAGAAVFHYEDDFETEKLRVDSHQHSPISPGGGGIPEAPASLSYALMRSGPESQRNTALCFNEGFGSQFNALVVYRAVPDGEATLGGQVEFQFLVDGAYRSGGYEPPPWVYARISVFGSPNGTDWLLYGSSGGGVDQSIEVPPGAPAQYIKLAGPAGEHGGGGTGMAVIDNLRITIAYSPEPSGLLAVVVGLSPLLMARRRGRIA